MGQTYYFWFTGLSSSGKSSVAQGVKQKLAGRNIEVLIVDGDDVRGRYNRSLGFSEEDIKGNNRRIAGMCEEKMGQADVVFVSIISPFRDSRKYARELLGPSFSEVYFNANLEVVKRRDVKGLYAKAQRNEIKNLIGFSSGAVYEAPKSPDFVVNSGRDTLEDSIEDLSGFVIKKLEESGCCISEQPSD